MKKVFYLLSFAVIMGSVKAQNVVVSGAHASSNGSYATLSAAFSAINAQNQTGQQVLVSVDANTTETASAVLNAGDWLSLKIFPSVSGVVVSGNLALPLVDLNGADRVVIDGRVGGSSSGAVNGLTLRNTNTSTTAGTSTVRFINGATLDTVRYSKIEGSGNVSASGTVFFSTSTAADGNSQNVIAHNHITNAGGNRPMNVIYAAGTLNLSNIENVIQNNDIYDFLNPAQHTHGVRIESNTDAWTISGNSFYETDSFQPTTSSTYTFISINNTSHNGSVIRGNFIGGTQAAAGGSAFTKLNVGRNIFYGIRLTVGTTLAAQVDSNVIDNIVWNNNTGADWVGLDLINGSADIGLNHGNRIGTAGDGLQLVTTSTVLVTFMYAVSLAGSGTINFRNNHIENMSFTAGVTGARLTGIYLNTTGTVSVKDNEIKQLTTTAISSALAAHIYGIHKIGSGTCTIENNIIGDTLVNNSLHAQSLSTSNPQEVVGIVNLGSGNLSLLGNSIANLTNAINTSTTSISGYAHGISSTGGVNVIEDNRIYNLTSASANTSANHVASVGGIVLTGASIKMVRRNIIYNLSNTFTNFVGHIYGIYFTGLTDTENGVYQNFIHTLEAPNNTGASAANIYGIRLLANATIANNIVVLQGSQTAILYGLYDTGNSGTNIFYHNTVYVGDTAAAGAAASYGLWSNSDLATQDYRNNILVNERTGGSGSHYAIRLAGVGSLTINHNLYKTSSSGIVGFLTSNLTTLAALQTATSQDLNSSVVSPQFTEAGGLLATDYIPLSNALVGSSSVPITIDYTGSTRVYRTMGAYDVVTLNPIEIIATVGLAQATYDNLVTAFSRINDGTHQGDVQTIVHVSHAIGQTALLNGSGSGSANYSRVIVYPSSSAIVVNGAIATPLVDLNGASNVVIDGRVNAASAGTPYSLTFRNTSTSSTANTSTLRFINGASTDTIRFVQLEGSSTPTASGTIFFSTTTAANGNNNNVLQNNRITNALGNRPVNSVYSTGTLAKSNTGNILLGNEIYDFFRPGSSSQGVFLEANNADWRIEGNSFYETGSLAPTSTFTYSTIWVNSTGINGSVIRSNYIGGSQAQAGGTAFTKTNSNSNAFYGIRINAGTTTASQVDSNIIRNISWTNSVGNNWFGIDVAAGLVDIGLQQGNRIGDSAAAIAVSQTTAATASNLYGINLAGSGNIRVRNNVLRQLSLSTAITGSNIWGIYTSSTGTLDIDTNTLSDITASATTGTLAANIYGIYKTSSAGTLAIRGNTIGSTTTANSLHASSASTSNAQLLLGIQSLGTGTVTISGNTIANLTNATTNATTTTTGLVHGVVSTAGANVIEHNIIRDLSIANANNSATNLSSVAGIMLTGGTLKTVLGNTIFNLRNTFTNFTGHIYGIYFTGVTGTNNGVYRNFIHSLEATGNTSTAVANLYGIRQVPSGVATLANNIVMLQGSGTALLYGLYDNGTAGTTNIYHNTVYIAGTASAGAAASYGLWSNAVTATQDYRNNVLVNERTGGTGTHYAIRLAGNTTLTINYNLYRVGSGGVTGFLTSNRNSLTDWQSATAQDVNSISADPLFGQAGSTVSTDYIPENQHPSFRGATLASVTDDFQAGSRSVYSIGAFEYPLAIWWVGGAGAQQKAWNNASNWSPAQIPDSMDIVWIQANGNGHYPILDQNRTVYSVDFNGANKKVDLSSYTLTLSSAAQGADANHYFQTTSTGTLKKAIGNLDSFTFPVGNSTYNPVTITNNTGTADDFSVRVQDAVLMEATTGSALNFPKVNRTWHIDKTIPSANAGSGVNFIFQWDTSQHVNKIKTFALNHYDGTNWHFAADSGGTQSVSGISTKQLTFTGYRGTFSPFAIGYENSPLPVSWKEVRTECTTENKVTLHWSTATEINNDYFTVERSADGRIWEAVGNMPGNGTTSQEQTYSLTDPQKVTIETYYRIKQTDYNGAFAYSSVVVANCRAEQAVRLYPNPAQQWAVLDGIAEGTEWTMYSVSGQPVAKGRCESSRCILNTADIPAGSYVLQAGSRRMPLVLMP